MFEVFLGTEKREHGDLSAAQKRVRQRAQRGAVG
jgi:hypothetical protein